MLDRDSRLPSDAPTHVFARAGFSTRYIYRSVRAHTSRLGAGADPTSVSVSWNLSLPGELHPLISYRAPAYLHSTQITNYGNPVVLAVGVWCVMDLCNRGQILIALDLSSFLRIYGCDRSLWVRSALTSLDNLVN